MKLLFEGNPIAELTNVFEHQRTWFADYCLCSALPSRVESFITFSREKLSANDFEESDLLKFAEYIDSGDWVIQTGESTTHLDGAPLFNGSDVSWVVRHLY
jgi:hypothetical protein